MSNSSLTKTIETAMLGLPPERQQAVLDFALFLRQRPVPVSRGSSLLGLWAELKADGRKPTAPSARHDIWQTFPQVEEQQR